MPLLIKFNSNWSDEMDVHGFFVATQEKWDQYCDRVRKHFETHNELMYYIGSNEEILYESADQLLGEFQVTEITDTDAETLTRLFKATWARTTAFGFTGPDVE